MKLPLMPKATAIWLIDNTALSFQQISEFSRSTRIRSARNSRW